MSLAAAEAMIGRGDIAAALPVLTATVQHDPKNGLAYYLLARAALAVGESAQCGALLDAARQFGSAALKARVDAVRGALLLKQNRHAEAALAFQKVIRAHKSRAAEPQVAAGAYHELGVLRVATGRNEEAHACFAAAARLAPRNPAPWLQLATLQADSGDYAAALRSLKSALEAPPENAEVFARIGSLLLDLQAAPLAARAFRVAVGLAPGDANHHANLGVALTRMEQREEAILCFREALARDAGHAMARHLLHSLTGENAPERASDGYVRQLFDTFAKTFDRSLVRDLQYSVPALIGVAADAIAAGRAAPLDILDLGCGTGLCGPLLRPLAGTLVGVDLSPRMLEAAKARGCYDELVEAEIVAWLGRRHAAFDLVTAADVFVYFGDIAPACAAVFDVLRPAGVFIFSVERHEGEPGFRLHGHGRYSHREPFLRASAEGAGFDLVRLEPITPRLDGGEPVDGYLVELKKPT